ncbi:MAG: TonB-dependent receptor, partial [Bacteroidota bacterium]
GTYPFFQYTQANVNLKGFDLELQYKLFKSFSIDSKTSVVRGWNKTIHDYLIFMPADRFDNSVKYEWPAIHSLNHCYISLGNITVLRQTRVPPKSDYVAPPKGYSIANASMGFQLPVKKKILSIDIAVYNLTNVSYRDYLNRYRYYADDLGINAVLRTKLVF